MKRKTAIYVRVSTDDQESGLESQKAALREYCDNHNLKYKFYTDRISGNSTKRPALDRLEKDIFMGKYKTVVVWALDRLTRRGPRDGLNLLGKWLDKDVRVVSITEQFDFYGPMGETIAAFCFSIAKMYRTALIENTKRGLKKAKEKGVRLGRKQEVFAADVQRFLDKGLSMSETARRLKCSRQSCYVALKRGA